MMFLFRAWLKFLHFFRRKVKVFNEDWDILIIADALRYDYAELNRILLPNYKLLKKNSAGSSSPDFIKYNFTEYRGDTIIITSNPYVNKLAFDKFFLVVNLWSNNWSEEFGTVLPETVFSSFHEYRKKYPNKKFILWLMQPHFPYITNTKFNAGYNLGKRGSEIGQSGKETIGETALKRLAAGQLDEEEFIQLYNDEVKNILKEVSNFTQNLAGKIVLTSDHGEDWQNYFGVFKIFEHPSKTFTKNLVAVPWFEYESGERIVSEVESSLTKEALEEGLTERLKSLGYHD